MFLTISLLICMFVCSFSLPQGRSGFGEGEGGNKSKMWVVSSLLEFGTLGKCHSFFRTESEPVKEVLDNLSF